MHLPNLCTTHRTVPAALFTSDAADQNNANGANHPSHLCGFTWEKWTKIIAYVETIIGTLSIIAIPMFLMELAYMKNNLVLREDSPTSVFANSDSSFLFNMMAGTAGISTSKITESHYNFSKVMNLERKLNRWIEEYIAHNGPTDEADVFIVLSFKGYHITLFMLQLAFTALAIYIVIGVTKKNLKHITQGILLKICLLILNLILFLSQLIVLACCGYGSGLWARSFMIVGDVMFIMIMNNYFKCERDALAASNQNGQLFGLPKLFGLLNSMFSIKIPYLMTKK